MFGDPDRVVLDRGSNPHLALGIGPHFCLGAHLARIELQEAQLALTERLPGLRLAVPAAELRWRPVLVTGVAELPVEHSGVPLAREQGTT